MNLLSTIMFLLYYSAGLAASEVNTLLNFIIVMIILAIISLKNRTLPNVLNVIHRLLTALPLGRNLTET